jgi:hypothetical protein
MIQPSDTRAVRVDKFRIIWGPAESAQAFFAFGRENIN